MNIKEYLEKDLSNVTINSVADLKHYRKSPNLGADATKPKIQLTTPNGLIYFKFGLTENEICAEILSFHLATALKIPVAKTSLAWYKDTLGIASWSIGEYTEPDDTKSYSILDFMNVSGFFEMCLFDYFIMNEDRHAGNWCIQNGTVAPLFDHNVCFGGENTPVDADIFMKGLTSPFDTGQEYHQQHDKILEYLYRSDSQKVKKFITESSELENIEIPILSTIFPTQYREIIKLFQKRIRYMARKVAEF